MRVGSRKYRGKDTGRSAGRRRPVLCADVRKGMLRFELIAKEEAS